MLKLDFTNEKWFKVIVLTAGLLYLYIIMEWIFFITKTSFMSAMNMTQKLIVLLVSSFILIFPIIVFTSIITILCKLLRISEKVIVAIPALMFTFLALILFDNFTYTVFNIGVVTSYGIFRAIYAGGFLVVFVTLLKKMWLYLESPPSQYMTYLVEFVFLITTIAFISKIPEVEFQSNKEHYLSTLPSSSLPNIILIGWDGVNANRTSAFGYERDTTPYLREFMQNALVAENSFSNTGNTGAALTSLLTGKLPIDTRVIFVPDILIGEDSYQHLPGILKQNGYSTIQITTPYYADAYERNILGGFDIVNFDSESTNPLLDRFASMGGGGAFYFTGQVIFRIMERVEHIFFIRDMENPYATVTKSIYAMQDDERIRATINYLDESEGPMFLHIHMMNTHGPIYPVPKQVFSAGETQDEEYLPDFYDDAILNADSYLKVLFDYLSKSEKIQSTIVILYSDHGFNWDPLQRVPLLFWFPDEQYKGTIHENVQLLDVAPTILDYLSIPQPAWMKGQSLLRKNPPSDRKILSSNVELLLTFKLEGLATVVDKTKLYPPFYQLGGVNFIVCDRWFSLNLSNPGLEYGKVEGSTALCKPEDIPSPEQAKDVLLQHLSDEGYDITSFPRKIPLKTVQP